MAYSSRNARAGRILLLAAHLFSPAMAGAEPRPLALVERDTGPAPTRVAPRRYDPNVATRILVESMRARERRFPAANRVVRLVDEVVASRNLVAARAVVRADLSSEGRVLDVALVRLEKADGRAWQAALREARARLRKATFDMRGPFRDGARIVLSIETERTRGTRFVPRNESKTPMRPSARLTEIDAPMEVNIPMPRFRGPMIDVVDFDVAGEPPRVTFRVEALPR